eukprot:5974925-Ditylum_brightwellii.AAC.1
MRKNSTDADTTAKSNMTPARNKCGCPSIFNSAADFEPKINAFMKHSKDAKINQSASSTD